MYWAIRVGDTSKLPPENVVELLAEAVQFLRVLRCCAARTARVFWSPSVTRCGRMSSFRELGRRTQWCAAGGVSRAHRRSCCPHPNSAVLDRPVGANVPEPPATPRNLLSVMFWRSRAANPMLGAPQRGPFQLTAMLGGPDRLSARHRPREGVRRQPAGSAVAAYSVAQRIAGNVQL